MAPLDSSPPRGGDPADMVSPPIPERPEMEPPQMAPMESSPPRARRPADEEPTTPADRREMAPPTEDAGTERVVFGETDTEEEPTLVPLFYGTNRARTDPGMVEYLKPFLLPTVALIVLYLLVFLIRRIVKTEYQKTSKIVVAVILLALCGWQLLSGVFKVVQMRQAERLSPVQYGSLRLEIDSGNLPFELGTCTVSIPPGHVPGNVELPDFRLLELRSDPAEHFVLQDITPLDPDNFHSKLRARVAESSERDLFVFVHGFHNTFQDAAFRTAQIAHDLKFKGAPVFFSWPSQGTVLNYSTDENNVRVAALDLKLFLQQLRAQSGAERIHLIAHSMGSRALTQAIESISLEMDEDGPVFNEMVLAAPDIDARELDQMAESMARVVDRVTLYASSRDEALAASRFVHGQTYQRAGETEPRPLVNEWIQTIDVSNVTSGHSYIADNGRVLTDLDDLITRSRNIDETISRKIPVGDWHYWQLGRSE